MSPEGFNCQLTLRGESGKEVLDKAKVAITSLLALGRKPSNGMATLVSRNGNGHKTTPIQEYCIIHDCPMKRWEKNGRTWYSHKIAGTENEWCNGKPKKGSQR